MRKSLLLLSAVIALAGPLSAETFTIDPGHSSVNFKVRHLVGRVTGKFDTFSGTFNYDAKKPAAWSANAVIEAKSVNTGIEKRDNHLRNADFFEVEKFPTITFKSTKVTDVADNKGKLHGDLTMHGVTKPVVLDLVINGVEKDPFGKGQRAGISATGKINRHDFGVGSATGPLASAIGEEIAIDIEVEAVSK